MRAPSIARALIHLPLIAAIAVVPACGVDTDDLATRESALHGPGFPPPDLVDAPIGGGPPDAPPSGGGELCGPEAIACPVPDEPTPPPEWITCADIIAGWVLTPEEHPDEIWGASGYSPQEIAANQPNEWFTEVITPPPPTCCTPGQLVYSYTNVGSITCNPPWVIPDEFNEASVTFDIYVDSSTICGQCVAWPIPPFRPPFFPRNMQRPPGAAPPPVVNKPVPVPPGTKQMLPPKTHVPGSKATATTNTQTTRNQINQIVNKPVLDHKPLNGTTLGATNVDFDLTGHQIEGTFYSGNRDVKHGGVPNYQWNRTQAENHAVANTDLAQKKVALNIRHTTEFDKLNWVDTANRIQIPGGVAETKVTINGKLYTLNGIAPAEHTAWWEKLSGAYARTLGNYIERAGKPGTAVCWLEGAKGSAVFKQAEWPELLKLWEAKFANGPHAGQRKLTIKYFQDGKWTTYDGTNPPAFGNN